VADRNRVALKTEVGSLGQWLEMLELTIVAEPLEEGNLERAAQLFNKTNQMNLSTRRMTPTEILSWANNENHRFWTFRVSDRFGDYGLCGICSFALEEKKGKILDFLLSCRVMGRGVEEAMFCTAVQHANSLGCEEVSAEYIQNPRNLPIERWLQSQPNLIREGNTFRFSLLHSLDYAPHINITVCER
jgi:FkbH-like protein